jgi:hypothetical protein
MASQIPSIGKKIERTALCAKSFPSWKYKKSNGYAKTIAGLMGIIAPFQRSKVGQHRLILTLRSIISRIVVAGMLKEKTCCVRLWVGLNPLRQARNRAGVS